MRWSNLQTAVQNMREWVRVVPVVGFTVNVTIILAAIWLITYVDSWIVFGIALVFGLAAGLDIVRYALGRVL